MTSTITSSGVRPTPAFPIPSTQNTAPVLEYRCLYTHDLRRKQKRWQDGLLRFHTFNKRIMVYDVSRNYIGDMHWRQNETFQDGDEFELDRGVLIQVGEATGSMEQDLTGLFEKKKKALEVAVYEEVPHEPVAVPIARPTVVQPSQLRPKTLNALLGTPKGRIGRAALPTKSPHELRTESESISCNQVRPAKRQRIESQLERRTNKTLPRREPLNVQDHDVGMNRRVVGAVVDNNSEENPVSTTVRKSDLPNAGISVNMLPPPRGSSRRNNREDDAFERMHDPLPKKRSSASGSSDLVMQQKQKQDQDSQVPLKAIKTAKRPDHELETVYASTSTITKPIEMASDEDATPTDQPPKQRLKLQIASRKPRKKLMYRELLPQESSALGRSSGDGSVLDRSIRRRSTSTESRKRNRDPMTGFHKEEQDRLKARLNRHRTKEIQRDTEREQFCGDAPEDLFLSQEPIETISAKHCRRKEKDSEGVSKSSMTGSRRRNTEPVVFSTRHSPSPEAPQEAIPRSTSSVHRTAVALAKMDEMLFPRAQPRISDSIGEKDALKEMLPQGSSPNPIPKPPPDRVSTPPAPKDDWSSSSPAFQIQNHVSSRKDVPQEETNILSKSNPDSLSAFGKVVQPKMQAAKRRKSASPPSDSHIFSIAPPPPLNPVSAPSPPKAHPASAPGLQTQPGIHPSETPTPHPPTALVPPPPPANPTSLLTSTKTAAPKLPTAPDPAPRRKPNNKPAFTKVTPNIPAPTPKSDAETIVEVPASQPPTPSSPQHPKEKRKPEPQLPAFTKVVPTKPPLRSGLRKSRSDTSSSMQRGVSALPVSGNGKAEIGNEGDLLENDGRRDESAAPAWNKEAWDLFGCGRDGVECTYEEFKRKEGLM